MFLIMGINPKTKEFNQIVSIVCPNCSDLGKARVYMNYTAFSLFFIPIIKWGKQYFVELDCCGSLYELDKEKGKEIAKGKDLVITYDDLNIIGYGQYTKKCPNCSSELDDTFDYCPKCGHRL